MKTVAGLDLCYLVSDDVRRRLEVYMKWNGEWEMVMAGAMLLIVRVQAPPKNWIWTSKEGTFSHFFLFLSFFFFFLLFFSFFFPPSLVFILLVLAIWPSTYRFVRPVGVCNALIPSGSCCHPWCLHWPSVFLVYVCVIAPWAESVLGTYIEDGAILNEPTRTFTSAVYENLRWGSENGDAVGRHSCVLLCSQGDKKFRYWKTADPMPASLNM